jgi:hypothetical protein
MTTQSIFVGSSTEARKCDAPDAIIQTLANTLADGYVVVPWWETKWANLSTPLDTLIEDMAKYDYAVFLASPDDLTTIRGRNYYQARDNVIFEFGLFLASLKKPRTFLLVPEIEGHEFRILSDLGQSATTQRYLCSVSAEGKPIYDLSSLDRAAQEVAGHIKRNHLELIGRLTSRSHAKEQLRHVNRRLRADISHAGSSNNETLLLNKTASYIPDLLVLKAGATKRSVADTCLDVSLYFELIEDMLNIEQLAEKQRMTPDNPIREVWVFADEPLEFMGEATGDAKKQVPKLLDTIVYNIQNGVKYSYLVSGECDIAGIRGCLSDRGLSEEEIENLKIFVLESKFFKTYYTVHHYGKVNREIYISALMENRNDLLIKASPDQQKRIHQRLERLIGLDTSVGSLAVRNFVYK